MPQLILIDLMSEKIYLPLVATSKLVAHFNHNNNIAVKQYYMKNNARQYLNRNTPNRSNSQNIQIQNEYHFQNDHYIFPNDLQVTKRFKSFMTVLDTNNCQLSDYHNKKLSQVNRSHFVIKLKQIKREEPSTQPHNQTNQRYLLYYEAIPYSLSFIKLSSNFKTKSIRIGKMLKEIVNDLIEFNIFCELELDYCGFTEQEELRVFIPPFCVLDQKKLTAVDKAKMNAAANSIVKFWETESIRQNQYPVPLPTMRNSIRYKSPEMVEQNKFTKKCEDQNTDIKKTIKLTKNYVKQLNKLQQNQEEKCFQLKKHKSMGLIVKEEQTSAENTKNSNFLSKIDNLNKKLNDIKEALFNKKSTDHPRDDFKHFISKEKDINLYRDREQQQDYEEEIIFEKKENLQNRFKIQNKIEHNVPICDEDRQSDDTYIQEIGQQYKMPKFTPSNELRNTTLPTELKSLKNAIKGMEVNSNWHHESAGNLAFKRIIQKNKETYPDLCAQVKSPSSISKISAPGYSDNSAKLSNRQFPKKLKKIISLDTFQSHVETKSINLSEFSNELSNVKRRKQKEQKGKHIKLKIQDILQKSKKAIQLLKHPIIKPKK